MRRRRTSLMLALLVALGALMCLSVVMDRQRVEGVNLFYADDKAFICISRAHVTWKGSLVRWLSRLASSALHPLGGVLPGQQVERGISVISIEGTTMSQNYFPEAKLSSLAISGSDLVVAATSPKAAIVLTEFGPGQTLGSWTAISMTPTEFGAAGKELFIDGRRVEIRVEHEDLTQGGLAYKARVTIGVSFDGGPWRWPVDNRDRWSTRLRFGCQ